MKPIYLLHRLKIQTNETKMNIDKLFASCKRELKQIGYGSKLHGNVYLSIAPITGTTLGRCINKQRIEIAKWIISLNDEILFKEILMHELLHTFPDTKNHDKTWKKYAEDVNKKLGYHISRCFDINNYLTNSNYSFATNLAGFKYEVKCTKCNKSYYFHNLSSQKIRYFQCNLMKCNHCDSNNFIINKWK